MLVRTIKKAPKTIILLTVIFDCEWNVSFHTSVYIWLIYSCEWNECQWGGSFNFKSFRRNV